MAANDNVTVSIVGNASGVAPAVDQAKADLGGLKAAVSELTASMSKLGADMRSSMASGASVGKAVAGGMKEAEVATNAESSALERMILKIHEGAEGIRTFQMRAKAFAEVYVAMFAVEQVAEFINKMGEAAEKTQHLAQQFGMSTGEIQRLNGVATATGIPVEALTKGMAFLDRNMANAEGGSKRLKATMDQVGIGFNDGRSQMEKLATVADKFKNMDDGPKKVALAMQLFGRSGKELIPILDLGSKGIEDLNAKMDEYGVRNEDAVAKGVALAESVNETKLGFLGISNVLTDALAPVFKMVVDGINELIAAFVESYRSGGIVAVVFATISAAIEIVVDIVKELASIFAEVWGAIVDILTDVGNDFADIFGASVPKNVNVTRQILNVFKDTCVFVGATIRLFIDEASLGFRTLMQVIVTFGKIAADAMSLNWGAIAGDWNQGMSRLTKIVDDGTKKVVADAQQMGAALAAAYKGEAVGGNKPTGVETPKAGGDFNFNPGAGSGGKKKKSGGDSLPQRLEQELEQKKTAWAMEQDAQGTFQQYSLQSEANFWAEALNRHNLSAKDRLAIEKKFLAARQALKKEEISIQLDGFQKEIEAAGANSDRKLAILREEQKYVVKMYGADSAEARKAADDIVKAERTKAAQIRELEGQIAKGKEEAALAGVDAEEAAAEFQVQMGVRTNAQMLGQERQFENQRFEIRRQALAESLRLAALDPNTSPAKLREIYQQVEQLERQHQAKLTQIDRQASAERTQMARQAFGQIGDSFGNHISKMITLQEGWKQGLIGIYQDLVQTVASVLQQIIAKWVTAFLTKLLLGKQEAAQNTANYIGQAGAGGVASMAAAPFPINMTAPAFGASMAAAAAAFGAVTAAEGGDWHVRDGLYHLHENEMVLPAWAASPLRNMIGSGGSSARPGSPLANAQDATRASSQHNEMHYSPTINHSDKSLKSMLRDGERDMRRWFANQARNGALKMPAE